MDHTIKLLFHIMKDFIVGRNIYSTSVGPEKYNSVMLKKMRKETQTQTESLTSDC